MSAINVTPVIIVTLLIPAERAPPAIRENTNKQIVPELQTRTEYAMIVLRSITVVLVSLVLMGVTRSVAHVKVISTKFSVPRISAERAEPAFRENTKQEIVPKLNTRTDYAVIVLRSVTVVLVSLVLMGVTRSVAHVKVNTSKWPVPRMSADLVEPVTGLQSTN